MSEPLPLDILALIYNFALHSEKRAYKLRELACKLSLVSPQAQDYADRFLYRNILLFSEPSLRETASTPIKAVVRLLSSTAIPRLVRCRLHVRSFTMRSSKKENVSVDVAEVLRKCPNIRKMDLDTAIPPRAWVVPVPLRELRCVLETKEDVDALENPVYQDVIYFQPILRDLPEPAVHLASPKGIGMMKGLKGIWLNETDIRYIDLPILCASFPPSLELIVYNVEESSMESAFEDLRLGKVDKRLVPCIRNPRLSKKSWVLIKTVFETMASLSGDDQGLWKKATRLVEARNAGRELTSAKA
ncbi:hypothetical protein DL96DRAFT_1014512 [Flagelloscypha sp. PMI_526]|nr:hypothetical protein DL96DRAFT_1014512 [Flagelloscypha sp. PMI_526]